MKKTKKGLFFIPTCLLTLSLVSCVLAQGTYTGEKIKVDGVTLEKGQNHGEVVYKLQTENAEQVFSKIDVSITQGRFVYKYGKGSLRIVASLSKTEDFAEKISVEHKVNEISSSAIQISFAEKESEIDKLNANSLFLKIEIITEENDATFDNSWIVMGHINVSGTEKLRGSETEAKEYFSKDFSISETMDEAYAFENVSVKEGKLVADMLGPDAYVIYELDASNETNSFEKLTLKVENSMLKSLSQEKRDENGEPVRDSYGEIIMEETGKTYISAYVSSDPTVFTKEAPTKIESSMEGVTSGEIDLSSLVSKIKVSKIYVRVQLSKDAEYEFENSDEHLNIGKISLVGEESKKVDSYLKRNFKEEGLGEKISSQNISSYVEKTTQEQLILRSGNECELITYSYGENGEVEKVSKIGTWTEKGVKYNRNWIAGLTEAQKDAAVADAQLGLTASTEGDKLYTGQYMSGRNAFDVYIKKVSDSYYELTIDVEKWSAEANKQLDASVNNALKAKAYQFSNRVFKDFSIDGEGNVVFVNIDGDRDLYIHQGKVLQRVSDLYILKR